MSADTSTLDQARGALDESPISALRELDVWQAGESIVISGRVRSFYEKQMAQELVRSVCREVELVNTVAVEKHDN